MRSAFCVLQRQEFAVFHYFLVAALLVAIGFGTILETGFFAVAVIGFVDLVLLPVTFVVCSTIFFAAGLGEVFFVIFAVVVFDAGLVIGLAEVTGAAIAIPPTVRALVSAKI